MGRGMGMGMELGGGQLDPDEKQPERWKLTRYDFIIQFIWKPTPRNVRRDGGAVETTEEDEFASLFSPERLSAPLTESSRVAIRVVR